MIIRFILLLLLSLPFSFLSARNNQYTVVNYTTDNSLPQNSITGIQFDKKGYCWLGTEMGLVRYDGKEFVAFNSDKIKGLKSDRIRYITKDTNGGIYIRTSGLVQCLWINDTSAIKSPVPVLLTQNRPTIPTLYGYAIWSPLNKNIKRDSIYDRETITASGNLYLLQSQSSYYITGAKTIPINTGKMERQKVLVTGESLILIHNNNKTSVWTQGIKQQDCNKINGPITTNLSFLKGDFAPLNDLTQNYVYAEKNLYRIYFKDGKLWSDLILEHLDIPVISFVYFNKDQNKYYIGSLISGLFVVTLSAFHVPKMPPNALGMGFYSQAVTEEGILCQRFLFRKDNTYKELPLETNMTSILYEKRNHSLYYAPGSALLRFNMKTGKTKPILHLSTKLSTLFHDQYDSTVLMFATSYSMGKIRKDTLLEEKHIANLNSESALFAAYPNGRDSFLLATWSGIKWYDFKRNKLYHSILDSLSIRILYPEQPQRIWIASYGKGFYLYEQGKVYKMPDGPFDALKTINAFIDDGQGYMWLTSNKGLYKVKKQALLSYAKGTCKEVYFYAFTTQNNLPANEFNACNPSYAWLEDSMLSLPTIKGLIWFYPNKIHFLLPEKGIYIDHMAIANNQVPLPQNDSKIILPSDYNQFTLKVSCPYFGNKENMRLTYKVEGLDDIWRTVSEIGEIAIDRIPAGEYKLLIRKALKMETGQYQTISLNIIVMPKFYNTWQFYLFIFVATALLFFLVLRLRIRLFKERNRKLEYLVAIQTKDMNQTIHKLAQSGRELKSSNRTKDNIITTVLHDLRSPIQFLHFISNQIALEYETMSPGDLQQKLLELKNSSASLNTFTEQFFTWAISQHQSFKPTKTNFNVRDVFREIEKLYSDILGSKGNRLIVATDNCFCFSDQQIVSTIIRNLLDNANKNTNNGQIILSALYTEKGVMIEVSDNGKGFDREALYSFLDKDSYNNRGGKGSFIVLHLLQLIEGQLEAVSEAGKGTSFKVLLPFS